MKTNLCSCPTSDSRPSVLQSTFRRSLFAFSTAIIALSGPTAHAAVKTWSLATGGNISVGTNWSPSGNLTSGDSLVFSNAGGGAIVFDSAVFGGSAGNASFLSGISFTGTPGAFVLDLSTNSFNISNPNAVTMASTVTNNQTIGTSAGSGTIFVANGASAGSAFFVNSSTSASLIINSNITKGDSGVSNSSIVFGNTNGTAPAGTGNIVVNGNISGNMGNGVSKTGTGTTTLAGNNTYTGGTNVGSGTLSLTGGISAGAITVFAGQVTTSGTGATGPFLGGTLTESTSGVISGSTTVTISSTQTVGGTAGSATLAGNNTTTGAITVGGGSNNSASPYNIATLGGALLTLSGANNSSANQTITVNPKSRLVLDFSAVGAPTNNILNNTSNGTVVSLAGSQLEVIGKSGAANSQILSTTTGGNGLAPIANTASQIKFTQNGATSLSLDLKAINRGGSATIDIVFPTTGTLSATNSATNGMASSGGVAFGTANNGTTLLGTSGTALSAYSGWQSGVGNYTSTTNVDVTNGDSVSGVTVSTLRFNGSNVTLTNSGTSNLAAGTLLVTPGTGATVTGGTIKPTASGNELLIINNGNLLFGSTITTNNAADKLTLISSNGQSGTATFTASNTIGTGGLFVNNTTATFSGNNTINGAVTVGYNGVLTLSGCNTVASNFTWATQGGGTLVLAGAGALGTGVLNTSGSGQTNTVKFASDSQVSGGGASTASINWSGGNGVFIQNYIMDRASAGTTAVNETFSSASLNQQGFWNLLQGSNYTAGFTLPTLTISGTTSYGSANSSVITTINAMGANVSLGNVTPIASNIKVATLVLNGSSAGNLITGVIADGGAGATLNQAAITKSGTGTWTLQGSNTGTGATTVNGGTLVLDYGTNNNSKISSTGNLTLSGGTLQLKGGSTSQAVAVTTFNTGQSAVTQNGGTSTIALGAITSTNGAADFTSGVATTSTLNGGNGLLGGLAKYTVGGADWAVSGGSGTNPITAFGSYTDLAIASGGGNATNYRLLGSNGTAITGALTLGTLKIAPSGVGQSLALGNNQLTLGNATSGTAGLLFTGSDSYSVSGTNTTGLKAAAGSLIFQDWATGVLSLNVPISSSFEKYGTGKLVLGSNAGASNTPNLYAGTLQVSSDAQLSSATTNTLTISGSYGNGSAIVANTAGASFAVPRPISLGAQGGSYIDVVGGNTLTLSGNISGTQSAVANNIVTFGGASVVDATNNPVTNGTIVLSGANTYAGGTTLAGGTVNLGVVENAGASGPLGSGGTITFSGGTLQYSASNAFDYSSRVSQVAGQQFKIDTNGQSVSYAYGLAGAGGSLTKSGAGSLTLTAANTYTGATTLSAGTLLLDGGGSLAASSAVSVSAGTFGGNGTVGGDVTIANGATLQAGIDTGDTATLALNSNLTLNATSVISLGLGSAGTHDILARTNPASTWAFSGTQSFNFLDQGAEVGLYSGIITGLSSNPGVTSWAVSNAGWTGTFTYNSGSIDFTLAAIPEPATWLLVGIGLTFLLYRKPRRRFER